jgi:dethiobiotin synthetase
MQAARAAGAEIDLARLDAAFDRIRGGSDVVIVEGAGGLLVPITKSLRYDGLFAHWGLELLIVAADRLGAINHSLLTTEAALRAGLRVRGVILNMPNGTRIGGNAAALRELIPDTPVLEFPQVDDVANTGSLAHVARACGLARLIEGPG